MPGGKPTTTCTQRASTAMRMRQGHHGHRASPAFAAGTAIICAGAIIVDRPASSSCQVDDGIARRRRMPGPRTPGAIICGPLIMPGGTICGPHHGSVDIGWADITSGRHHRMSAASSSPPRPHIAVFGRCAHRLR